MDSSVSVDGVGELLQELSAAGVRLTANGGQLKVSGSRGALTEDIRRRLVEQKEALLLWLQDLDAPPGSERPRIAPHPEADHLPFPLSDLQLGFYVADDPYMEFHVRPHCYMEFDLLDLDVAAYQGAWNRALTRHRRELCIVDKDLNLRLIQSVPQVECRVYDLRGLEESSAEAHLLDVREEMERQQLPLDQWPWLDLRVSLWNDSSGRRVRIHYNHNNYFVDGHGTMQLLAEIDEYYRDPDLTLPPLALSYRDAMLGLDQLAESRDGKHAHQYWTARLAALPPPPDLPQKPGVSRRRRSHLERREVVMPNPLWVAFKKRAGALGLTPSNAIVAAYASVVGTWCNQDHFILSQMVTRRFGDLHPDLLKMLGNFVSLYPLEIKLDPDASFTVNAISIQRQVLSDLEHMEFGGMRVLQELNHLRGEIGTAPSPFVVGSGLWLEPYRRADYTVLETSQTILDHQFFQLPEGGCLLVWDVIEDLFPGGLVDDMWAAYRGLMHRLAGDPDAWEATEFDLVPAKDLVAREARNRNKRQLGGGRSLHGCLGRGRADSPAVISGRRTLSYGDLRDRAAVVASGLRSQGVSRGDLVPVVMERDHDLVVGILAVLMCGAAYVPMDPSLPRARRELLLNDLNASVVLSDSRRRDGIDWPEHIVALSVSRLLSEFAPVATRDQSDVNVGPVELAYVIYTSGSTGTPKGVMIAHGAALNTVRDINDRFGIGPGDRLFGVSAPSFDLSVYDIFGTLDAAACLVYPRPEAALDPSHWLDVMLAEEVTVWNSAPAMMHLLVDVAEQRGAILPYLRLVLLSGDKIPTSLPERIRDVAPGAELVSLGGATEASIWSIAYPIGEVDPDWPTIPYGYPLTNQEWHVLDRAGRHCPTWVPGELHIGGVGLARGYWRDPEKTAASFRTDLIPGERLYRTGDRGRYLPDGCIEWLGRVDFQVKVQGQRIELGEIEASLVRHPGVSQAVVTVYKSPSTKRPRLVGFVVPSGEHDSEPADLEGFLRDTLPGHMVPRAWRFVDELPLTANGKVDRRALPATPTHDQSDSRGVRSYVAPTSRTEAILQGIWERLLGLDEVGVTDDFFTLGGQSFDAVRMFAEVKEEFGHVFSLSDIWRARTIRSLADSLADPAATDAWENVVPIEEDGSGPPLFLLHPAGGSILAYFQLRGLLDRPIYGIRAQPRPAEESRRTDVAGLASHYLAAMRRIRRDGPYALGGWSTGAIIAFEMAAQLEQAGELVEGLFMLDGPTPQAHSDLSDQRLLRWFLDDLGLELSPDYSEPENLVGQRLPDRLATIVTSLGQDAAELPDVDTLASVFEVYRDVVVAGARYRPVPIGADITVVRAEDGVVEEFATHPERHSTDWGWSRFTRGAVRCVQAAGTHHTFLNRTSAREWSAVLRSGVT